jgi:hypothetical protein
MWCFAIYDNIHGFKGYKQVYVRVLHSIIVTSNCGVCLSYLFVSVSVKDVNSTQGGSDTRCSKMETGEQCILGKWLDNGANHAPNSRITVNKTLIKNKETDVINDLFVNVILCGSGNRKKEIHS